MTSSYYFNDNYYTITTPNDEVLVVSCYDIEKFITDNFQGLLKLNKETTEFVKIDSRGGDYEITYAEPKSECYKCNFPENAEGFCYEHTAEDWVSVQVATLIEKI